MNFKEIKVLFKDEMDSRKNFYYKKVLDILSRNQKLTTEELMSDLKMNQRSILKILYDLFDLGLISYKKIDNETIYWELRKNSIDWVINRKISKSIKQLRELLEVETNQTYFICEKCGKRYPYFIAFDCMFKCPYCKSPLTSIDNSQYIELLKKRIDQLLQIKLT